jgi:hypothetical protein
MLTATVVGTDGEITEQPAWYLTVEAPAPAPSIATARRANTTSSVVQLTLALTTGYHAGPLFIVQKRRAPVIHGGTLGGKRRRQREARATPAWADLNEIRAKYREAKRLSKLTGELYVVDHIVPLDGKLVCGLHVHWNMRVVHWLENSKKSWHTWPDMPFEQLELI